MSGCAGSCAAQLVLALCHTLQPSVQRSSIHYTLAAETLFSSCCGCFIHPRHLPSSGSQQLLQSAVQPVALTVCRTQCARSTCVYPISIRTCCLQDTVWRCYTAAAAPQPAAAAGPALQCQQPAAAWQDAALLPAWPAGPPAPGAAAAAAGSRLDPTAHPHQRPTSSR